MTETTYEILEQFATELAEEARDNGNSWEMFCQPRLNAIIAAL